MDGAKTWQSKQKNPSFPVYSFSILPQFCLTRHLIVGRNLIPGNTAKYLTEIITQQLFYFNAHDQLVFLFCLGLCQNAH